MAYAYDNEEFSRYYDTFVAEHVSNDEYFTDTVQQVYDEVIRRSFIPNQRAIVVDLGCGTGDDLMHFQNHFRNDNVQFIGIDHSQAMLTRAKEKLTNQAKHPIELLHGDLTNFAQCLPMKPVDCILLPAGTFHHLHSKTDREQFVRNLVQVLRPDTGLFSIYLMPDAFIHTELPPTENTEEKFRLISTENLPQTDDEEWICKHTFELNVPPRIELSWQLRTCSIPKLIELLHSHGLEMLFFCLNGKDLLSYDEHLLSSLKSSSTPVILVFRTIKHTTN